MEELNKEISDKNKTEEKMQTKIEAQEELLDKLSQVINEKQNSLKICCLYISAIEFLYSIDPVFLGPNHWFILFLPIDKLTSFMLTF